MDRRVHTFSRREAIEITGGLSHTQKMPCPSWGIPTAYCQTGAKLSKIEGSVCSKCYAKRGPIAWPAARGAQERRLEGLKHPQWVEAMTDLISMECDKYFRWFDVGDLQSMHHLEQIVQIANNLPRINFWLPTHEAKYIRRIGFVPFNLAIRLSAPMIDGAPSTKFPITSTVNTLTKSKWAELVKIDESMCPAPAQDNKCLDCRKCWDWSIANVAYRKH